MYKLFTSCLLLMSMAGMAQNKPDTIREAIVVYTKIPGYMWILSGYSIQQGGHCIGHLRDNKKPFKLPLRIWDCGTERDYRTAVFGHDTGILPSRRGGGMVEYKTGIP